ncbi:MAG: erythromycin esterase family protein [Propionibacteriaceae bacterium]
MRRRVLATLITVGVLAGTIPGCSAVDPDDLTATAVPLRQAEFGDLADKEIIGVGEASHGNAEMVEVRQVVLEKLVTEHDVRTLALEADFGGTRTANEYVAHGTGTAEEAAGALGFDMFRTEETADLLRWIHDHNRTVPTAERVRLYGFDMQRYDQNKQWLLDYLGTVDPDRVEATGDSLADLTDDTRVDQSNDRNAAGAQAAQDVIDLLDTNEAEYVAATSADEFALARHHAHTIQRCAELQSSGKAFGTKRDAWMAENVQWLQEFEQQQGRDQMMLGGHNGHIDKTGASLPFPTMGQALAAAYGEEHVTIGTDFGDSTFISRDSGSDERKAFTVSHDAPLAGLFGEEPMGYVDVDEAAREPGNREVLYSEVSMGATDDTYRSFHRFLPWTYSVAMVPADAYDALVYIPDASPVTPLPQR